MQLSCRYCYIHALYGCYLNVRRKRLTAITQECSEQYWTSPRGSTRQSSNCMATYHPSQKTIQFRRTRYARRCWRSKDELISEIFLWSPSQWRSKAGWPARTYISLLWADTECSLEDLLEQWKIERGGERGPGRSVLWHVNDMRIVYSQ